MVGGGIALGLLFYAVDLLDAFAGKNAAETAARNGSRATVLDPAAMERLGMGCVLAVGRGSPNPPRFIELVHDPKGTKRGAKPGAVPTVVVIGKGVTFDTGGVSLKPRDNMKKMKYDMAGGATALQSE